MSGQIKDRGGCNSCGTTPSPRCFPNNEWTANGHGGCGLDIGLFDLPGCQYRCRHVNYSGSLNTCCLGNGNKTVQTDAPTCDPAFTFRNSQCIAALTDYCSLGDRIIKDDLCKNWCQQNLVAGTCDRLLTSFCSRNTNKPECGCAMPAKAYAGTSIVGPLECVDKRCNQNPRAIRLSAQKGTACKIVNCVQEGINIDLIDSDNINVNFTQDCDINSGGGDNGGGDNGGGDNGDGKGKNTLIFAGVGGGIFFFFMMMIIIVMLI